MRVIESPADMQAWARKARQDGETIALVPTMGFFHAGHLALMRKAKQLASNTVVSLFVNPLQFGPSEDLAKYPRDFARDSRAAAEQGVDVLFAPSPELMYDADSSTIIHVEAITDKFCGASRPGHFDGVATVVAKLFNLAFPHFAVFGEKDWQQLAVIRRMVRDLNWPVEIVGHPIVREADGLAMSSRNTYLSEQQRKKAVCLYEALCLARRKAAEGIRDRLAIEQQVREFLDKVEGADVEYADIVQGEDLATPALIGDDAILLLAVRIGTTRLIDNGRICYHKSS